MKKTLILGATTNEDRYAYKAAYSLIRNGHSIVNVGIRKGVVAGQPIENIEVIHQDIDTITLYVGTENQENYYDYILKTHPKRLIFNPGTENEVLMKMAQEQSIETVEACTLVMLSVGNY